MSDKADGTVLLIGAAVLGLPVIAGAALAGLGYVTIKAGAEAVVACGRELGAMARENAELRRAILQAARTYDYQLQEEIARGIAARADHWRTVRAQYRENQALRREAFARMEAQLSSRTNAPSLAWADFAQLEAVARTAIPPAAEAWTESVAGWRDRVQRLDGTLAKLEETLAAMQAGPESEVLDLRLLVEDITEHRQRVDRLHKHAWDVISMPAVPVAEVREYDEILRMLRRAQREMSEFQALLPDRLRQREAAYTALCEARAAIDAAADRLYDAGDASGLRLAESTLENGLKDYQRRDFVRAATMANAAVRQVELLSAAVSRQRVRNLELLLVTLRQQVEPLGELEELRADVSQWIEDAGRIASLQPGDVDRAWEAVDESGTGLAARAAALHEQAIDTLRDRTVIGLASLAAETLGKMGFAVEPGTPGEIRSVFGNRGDGSAMVTVDRDGRMSVDLKGFEGPSCHEVLEEFLARVREEGVQGVWQEDFSLSAAVERLSLTLLQAGLDVRIEPDANGATVVATGQVPPGRTRGAVDYDGALSGELAEQLQPLWEASAQASAAPVHQMGEQESPIARYVREQQELQRRLATMRVRA